MPRIAFEHELIDAWYEQANGEGSSTFEVCTNCFSDCGETAEDLDLTDKGYNGDPVPDEAIAAETGTDMEIMDGFDNYTCDCCGDKLTSDNY